MTEKLRITEIFHSLQGEARTVGWPTVFVRLTGCPLRCGYCDTAYAFSGGLLLSIAEILAPLCVRNRWRTSSTKILLAIADCFVCCGLPGVAGNKRCDRHGRD